MLSFEVEKETPIRSDIEINIKSEPGSPKTSLIPVRENHIAELSPCYTPIYSPENSLIVSGKNRLLQDNNRMITSFQSHSAFTSEKAIKLQKKLLKDNEGADQDFFASIGEEFVFTANEELDKKLENEEQKETILPEVKEKSKTVEEGKFSGKEDVEVTNESLGESGLQRKEVKRKGKQHTKFHERFSIFKRKEDKLKRLNTRFDTLYNSHATKINLTFWEFISSHFRRRGLAVQKVKSIRQGMSRIDERLDIFNILKKLREIDKLKAVLLEEHHRILFNGLPKPEINLSDGEKETTQGYKTQFEALKGSKFVEEAPKREEVLESFREVMNKQVRTQTDQKLIDIYDEIFSLKNSAQT